MEMKERCQVVFLWSLEEGFTGVFLEICFARRDNVRPALFL